MFYLISKNSSLTKDITEISSMLQKTNLNYGEVKEKNVRLVEEKSKLNKEIDALKDKVKQTEKSLKIYFDTPTVGC